MSVQPENVEKTSLQVVRFLEILGILEQSSEEISDVLKKTNFSIFKAYLIRINGLIRGIKSAKRQIDGEHVMVGGDVAGVSYLPPKFGDREVLLKEAFIAFKGIESTKDQALLFYLIIQALHYFVDGNGRLGRFTYRLLHRKNGEKKLSPEEIIAVIDHSNEDKARAEFTSEIKPPEEIYNFVMREVFKDLFGEEFFNRYGRVYSGLQLGYVSLSEARKKVGVPPDQKKMLQIDRMEKILSEACSKSFDFNEILLCMYLKNHGKIEDPEYVRTGRQLGTQELSWINSSNRNLRLFFIDGEKIIDELTAEDYDEVCAVHDEIKRLFIKKLISIIAEPDKYVFEDGTYIKDHFFQKPKVE